MERKRIIVKHSRASKIFLYMALAYVLFVLAYFKETLYMTYLNTKIVASIILMVNAFITFWAMIELIGGKKILREFATVIGMLLKYLTLFLVAVLILGIFQGASIDRNLNIIFDIMFIYLGPWAILSAALDYYYEMELVF